MEVLKHECGVAMVRLLKPLEYYHNNITGTLILCDEMRKHGVKSIVFSSSATVYGNPAFVPITEECPKGEITNPYGRTKGMLEQILTDLHTADPEWQIMLLRYFNPIGAHPSALIGELPNGVPNNLIPFLTQTVAGIRPQLSVFGDDYNTPDGSPTGIISMWSIWRKLTLWLSGVYSTEKIKPITNISISEQETGFRYWV